MMVWELARVGMAKKKAGRIVLHSTLVGHLMNPATIAAPLALALAPKLQLGKKCPGSSEGSEIKEKPILLLCSSWPTPVWTILGR